MLPQILTEQEARAIMTGGLAKFELELATSFTAQLYWVIKHGNNNYQVRNGSAFFLDTGTALFGVTANHVFEEWRKDTAKFEVIDFDLGSGISFDIEAKNRIIASHPGIDIATFQITNAEISRLRKLALTGYQKSWPPKPPGKDRGIYHSGFACNETIWSPSQISFGIVAGGGVASSINERDISSQIEHENLFPVFGNGIPADNYNFSGISGGPMIYVVEARGIRSWALAGVIYEGPNPSPDETQAIKGLQIIKARRAHFITPHGQLDVQRWSEI
jgi:hypothetical protein